jgi:hypothetical protein
MLQKWKFWFRTFRTKMLAAKASEASDLAPVAPEERVVTLPAVEIVRPSAVLGRSIVESIQCLSQDPL